MSLARFVGRRAERGEIASGLRAGLDGAGQVLVVSGEPGIGKTRLAQEASRIAAELGMVICWGKATDDDGSPPYWVMRQVIRTLIDRAGATPGLADPLPLAPELGGAPDERFTMFEAVTQLFISAGAEDGLLVVVDDLQWADPPALRLLVHLGRSLVSSRVVLLVAYRDTETVGREALSAALAALAREPAVSRMRLVGLTNDEVRDELVAVTGRDVSSARAAAISRRTRGNPFFVAELGRLGEQADERLPAGVADAVRDRLRRLTATCQEVLRAAAVIGADVDPAALAEITGRPLSEVLGALDEASAAGVISASDGWRFEHDLVREAADLDASTAGRLATHQRMAAYLAGHGDADERAYEIAYHRLASLPVGDAGDASRWAERAADQAMAQLAWERAVELYARALAVAPDRTPRDRADLLRRLGAAQLRVFDHDGAEQSLRAAATAAREAGDSSLLAEIALAVEGMTDEEWLPWGPALCDEALAALAAGPSALRARLLALRACVGAFAAAPEHETLSEEALAIAERVGDPAVLKSALQARQMVRSGPDGVADRLDLGARMLALGTARSDDDAALWGRLWRFDAQLQTGELDAAEAELGKIEVLAERLRGPTARWRFLQSTVAVAIGRGRLDEGMRRATESVSLARAAGYELLEVLSSLHLVWISAVTGRPDALDETAQLLLRRGRRAYLDAVLCWWLTATGRADEARAHYRPRQVLAELPVHGTLPGLAILADLAAAFDDRRTAADVYHRLLPCADLFASGGAGVVAVLGSVHTPLGLGAATTGRLDDAVRHLRLAAQANERAGMPPFTAVARVHLAGVLARRRRPGDVDEAAAIAALAGAEAERLGMTPLAEQARALSGSAGPDGLTRRERQIANLVAQGLTNRQIAAAEHISERTVETHVARCLAKLDCRTRAQLAVLISAQK